MHIKDIAKDKRAHVCCTCWIKKISQQPRLEGVRLAASNALVRWLSSFVLEQYLYWTEGVPYCWIPLQLPVEAHTAAYPVFELPYDLGPS
jgi:hypothetical protein